MPSSFSLVSSSSLRARVTGSKGQQTTSWYRGIFAEAFSVSWNHKVLWLFGLFAALLGFGSELWGLADVFSRATSVGAASITWGDAIFGGWDRVRELVQTPFVDMVTNPVVVAGGMLLLVMLVLLVLAVLSQGALFSVLVVNRDAISVREGLRLGSRTFWKITLVNIVARLCSLIAFLTVCLPLLAASQSQSITTVQLLLQTLALVLLIPFMLVVSVATKLVLVHSITHTTSLHDSIRESLRILRNHWLVIVEFVILLFVLNISVFVALKIGAVVIMLPFLAGIALSYTFAVPIGVTACFVGWILATLVFVVLTTAFISTVEYAAWVGLYRRLVREPITAKVERLARSVFGFGKR